MTMTNNTLEHLVSQIQTQDGSCRSGNVMDTVTRENPMITCPEDDRFNESLLMLLKGHQDLQRHRKQQCDETLQESIQNSTDLTKKAMGLGPTNVTNRVIIFLFINNLYSKISQGQ